MTVHVRCAASADAHAIASVHTRSWASTYPGLMPDAFLTRMTSPEAQERRLASWERTIRDALETVWVAEDVGKVVAFASTGVPRDHPGVDAELFTLYSLPEVQGRGVGRALLTAALHGLRESGSRSAACWVLDVNPTRAWYARQGAHEDGEKAQPIPEGELREVRMVWPDLSAWLGSRG